MRGPRGRVILLCRRPDDEDSSRSQNWGEQGDLSPLRTGVWRLGRGHGVDGSSQYYPPSVFPLRELPTGFPGRLAYIEAHAEGAAWRLVPKIARTPWCLSGTQLRMIALELHDRIERGGAQLLWMLTPRHLRRLR